MKTTVFLLILGLSAVTGIAQAPAKKKVPVKTDTIQPGQMVCIEGNVVQFNVTVVQNGIITKTTTIKGNCYLESFASRPGNMIYCDEIVISPAPGTFVRVPPRKFYVNQKIE